MRDVGMQCFKDVIHDVVTNDVRTAVLDLIQQEREGETVDHGLLKSVVEVRLGCALSLVELWDNDCAVLSQIFVEMGMGELEVYQSDFEAQVRATCTPSWCSQYPELMPRHRRCGLCERSVLGRDLCLLRTRGSALGPRGWSA